jgi:Flp pilus assembly protein TadG
MGILMDKNGSAAVEMAIVLPVFLAFVFGIVEFGRLVWIVNDLHYAVEEGARCAAIDCATGATTKASNAVTAVSIPAASFVVAACNGGVGKQVSIAYSFTFITQSFLLPNTGLTLTAQSCQPTST